MQTVNMHEAKTHLSRLIEKAVNGEPFIIARAGKPLVRVEAIASEATGKQVVDTSRRFGFLRGQFKVPKDFDTMMQDEIIEMFKGNPDKFKPAKNKLAKKTKSR